MKKYLYGENKVTINEDELISPSKKENNGEYLQKTNDKESIKIIQEL